MDNLLFVPTKYKGEKQHTGYAFIKVQRQSQCMLQRRMLHSKAAGLAI